MSYIIHAVRVGLMAGLLLGLFATSAWADSGWYAGIKGGVGFGADADFGRFSLDTDAGPVVLGTLGYAAGNGARVEAEVSWRSNDFDGVENLTFRGVQLSESNLTNLAFMLNGAYDFPLSPHVTPYVLGGVGFSLVDGELTLANGASGDDDATAFAYQVGAGLAYQLTDALAFDVSYRFFGTNEVEFELAIDVNNTHHTGLAGFTYSF